MGMGVRLGSGIWRGWVWNDGEPNAYPAGADFAFGRLTKKKPSTPPTSPCRGPSQKPGPGLLGLLAVTPEKGLQQQKQEQGAGADEPECGQALLRACFREHRSERRVREDGRRMRQVRRCAGEGGDHCAERNEYELTIRLFP